MKLAVIISGSDYRRNVGINKIALTRAELLHEKYNYSVDYYYLDCIKVKFSLLRFIKGDIGHVTTMADGRLIHLLQKYEYAPTNRFNRNFLELYYKKHKRRFSDWEWQQELGKYLKNYVLISAHYNDAAFIAYGAKRRYGIPYCVTWHGSDIHTVPFIIEEARIKTILAMENADCNFFVSNALLKTSNLLTINARKEVIYNSVDDCFLTFSESKRDVLRHQYNVENKKVVSFVGHIIDIKNTNLLPGIFNKIYEHYSGSVEFWIVGQGHLEENIKERLKQLNLICKMFGFVEPDKMPELLNCTDVLVLPSKNEGLPLVTIEALRCGANVVASNVGGISEVIGIDNVVDLDNNFIDNFSNKVVSVLENPIKQICPEEFDWCKIVEHENYIYTSII